jgi:hypothetical protein
VSEHNASRPSWKCTGCGDPWPCTSRQRQLLAEYDRSPVALILYANALFLSACVDMPYAPAGELHARFLGWIR